MKSKDVSSLTETELELTRAIIDTVVSTGTRIDKVSTWLLAGVGATVALIVANLDKTSLFIGVEHLREVLVLLLVAGLFGFAEKYLAVLVQNQLHVTQRLRNAVDEITENLKKRIDENRDAKVEFDPMRSVKEIQRIVPWYERRSFRKSIENSSKDPLYGHKRSAHLYNMQVLYALLQLVCSVVAIFIIALNV